MFDNRIKIVSLGHLPNSLTVEKIRHGNSIIRNPILVSYVSNGILPYRGLGSGIKRALKAWPGIDFVDDRNGCLFSVTVHRKVEKSSEEIDVSPIILEKVSGKVSGKTSGKILTALEREESW
jgi:ATP-dependent DNA helicase RecG